MFEGLKSSVTIIESKKKNFEIIFFLGFMSDFKNKEVPDYKPKKILMGLFCKKWLF